jgi:hypothetical protein
MLTKVSRRRIRCTMPIYPIDSFDGHDGGLDFGEFWNDPTLVGNVVKQFSAKFQGAHCYCLRLNPVHDTLDSTFVPYNETGLPSHPMAELPIIEFHRLLLDDQKTWPVLGRWVRGSTNSRHPDFLANGKWHGEVRLKSGGEFVGFLKAVIVQGSVPHDAIFQIAYREVKAWLDWKREERRRIAVWSSADAKASLATTRRDIEQDLKRGERRLAIYELAALITSHLTTGFNRIACLLPTAGNVLECHHAHGGDCTDEWAKRVQEPLARDTKSPDELQTRVRLQVPPVDDPLYVELVARRPLRIPLNVPCVARQIWDDRGKLDSLPASNQVLDGTDVEFAIDGICHLFNARPIAAKFHLDDAWLGQYLPPHPGSALRASRNGNIYVLPWTVEARLAGLWLLDLGQWKNFNEQSTVVPRLKVAKEILDQFSSTFATYI